MGFDDLMGTSMRLIAPMEALAALAARLQLGGEGGDPAVTAALDRVVAQLGTDLGGLSSEQRAQTAGTIRAFFLQAAELIAAPARAPGWVYEDPAILQAQGVGSSAWPQLVARVAPAGVAARLERPGARLLDVGTGVAMLAIAACRTWPGLSVVGLDPWEPALVLARRNVAAAGLDARIELRCAGVEALADEARFDVAWIPGPFLPPRILDDVCGRVRAALAPGGWAVFGVYGGIADPLSQALTDLRVVRSGGAVLGPDDAAHLLERAGFADVQVTARTPSPMQLVAGRR